MSAQMLRSHILVVEDEPIAELLVYLLAEEGYSVRHAPDGLAALALLSSTRVT